MLTSGKVQPILRFMVNVIIDFLSLKRSAGIIFFVKKGGKKVAYRPVEVISSHRLESNSCNFKRPSIQGTRGKDN